MHLSFGPYHRAMATKAKAKVNHFGVGGTSVLLISRGRLSVTIVTSLDTGDGIALRGRDPRVTRHHCLSHQWDMHKRSLFLLAWARGTGISLRVLHKRLLLHRYAREVRVWVKAGDRAS